MTRTYPRGAHAAIDRLQLNAQLDAALGLLGCDSTADATVVSVTHPDLTAAHDPMVTAVLRAYVFDPTYGAPDEPAELRDVADALRRDDVKAAVTHLNDYLLRRARGAAA